MEKHVPSKHEEVQCKWWEERDEEMEETIVDIFLYPFLLCLQCDWTRCKLPAHDSKSGVHMGQQTEKCLRDYLDCVCVRMCVIREGLDTFSYTT